MNIQIEEENQINQKQIEAEVDALLENSHPKGQNPYDLNIDFEEFDDVFENKELPDVQIDSKEIKRMLNEYNKKLGKEIEEEIEKTYKPYFSEEDHKRVEHLLEADVLINQALVDNKITKEELLMFIDYYEILSLMNRTQRDTLVHFKALNELLKKDVKGNDKDNNIPQLDKLTEEIENKINLSENILNNKSDYQLELNKQKEYLASQIEDQNGKTMNNLDKTEMNKSNISKEDVLRMSKNFERNALQSQNQKIKLNSYKINRPIKNKIELFNDNNQITNLLKVRNDRKEIIKTNFKQKGSHRSDLFKFPKLKPINENNKQVQFSQMFEGPKEFLEKAKIAPEKKNFVRKKIEDAQKYYQKINK